MIEQAIDTQDPGRQAVKGLLKELAKTPSLVPEPPASYAVPPRLEGAPFFE